MLSPTKQQCYDILEDARKDYAKVKQIVSEIPVKSAYTYAAKAIDPRIPSQIQENDIEGNPIVSLMEENGIKTTDNFIHHIQMQIEDFYLDENSEDALALEMALALYAAQIECEYRVDWIMDAIKNYTPQRQQSTLRECQLLREGTKNILACLTRIKIWVNQELSDYVDNERFGKREMLKDRKNERLGRKMDATRGLMHIHASRHPTAIRAHKTTPKKKNGICRLENSVRRMF